MIITLGNSVSTVTLHPDFNSEENKQLVFATHTTIGGIDADFVWEQHEVFNLSLKYVPNSDCKQINNWWLTRTQLSLYYDSASYDIQILNANLPFSRMDKPYSDMYSTVLLLEKI